MSTPSVPTTPKKIGILVVGLGGNNGVTLLAGHIANNASLTWETQSQTVSANWYGCVTQLEPRGKHGGVGFRGRYPLADANDAAVGGWDIRSTPLGDALYDCRVLEYDLVRKVRDEMNGMKIMEGVYDPDFVGESQHSTATHVVSGDDAKNWRSKVERLRRDIRSFKADNGVDGHTTVIWSASVERLADVEYENADALLEAIDDSASNDDDLSPSILYAVASALEGCSFVNGGSQNTLSSALSELYTTEYRNGSSATLAKYNVTEEAKNAKAYALGTDFKAGQTKFKTCAVEYIRALGLKPTVIASSNHLGNNDMLNLTSKKTVSAKLRVKKDIFGPWEEVPPIDHQVRVMYTPYIGDEKRDVVEYTSLGFLGCTHTMLTYTRCMDSILCVPLMVDSAVWCDYFSRCGAGAERAAKATAYLFKVPEGGARGVDPGFFRQMGELESVLKELGNGGGGDGEKKKSGGCASLSRDDLAKAVAEGIITKEQADKLNELATPSK